MSQQLKCKKYMNIKKPLFLVFALFALAMPFGRSTFTMAKADGEENRVWLETQDNVVETNSYYAGVYLNTHEELSALSVEIHFNPDVVAISSTYNSISANIYDYSIQEESLNYTYIFNEVTLDSNQQLFYFYYQVVDGVTPGRYYFDIVISEAYNSSLKSVEISTARKYIDVTDKTSIKTSYACINGSSNISTSYNEEITFSYYLDNSEPSSGAFVIRYDDTLFEFVSLTKLDFFSNMICDYNASAKGEILVTFAEVTPDNNTNLFTITLRTIKNVDASTQISLLANELYDTDMNPMGFSASKLNVTVNYDPAYETHPSVSTSAVVNTTNHQVVFTISLEENSHLGAGDFVFKFNKNILTYVESTKLISPTFFNVNDKETQLEQGQIKFSILSTTDIVAGGDILKATFSYSDTRNNRNSSVILTGSGLTDALTNPIELDISGTDFVIPGVDLVLLWIDSYMYMDDESFIGEGSGRCISDNLYEIAKRELLKLDAESIGDFESNSGNKYTAALARYQAWARANHDNNPFEANYDFLSAPYSNLVLNQNGSIIVVYILVITTIITGVGCFVLIRRKKNK